MHAHNDHTWSVKCHTHNNERWSEEQLQGIPLDYKSLATVKKNLKTGTLSQLHSKSSILLRDDMFLYKYIINANERDTTFSKIMSCSAKRSVLPIEHSNSQSMGCDSNSVVNDQETTSGYPPLLLGQLTQKWRTSGMCCLSFGKPRGITNLLTLTTTTTYLLPCYTDWHGRKLENWKCGSKVSTNQF